ncbi:MAG TPA: FAD-dependent oxidoreductase [Vicinamibacteria bacterium]|nr:FAD-dependent oxidoreductase [Vicinamibacteria bacterium]
MKRADIAIIGGGIIGTSIAYHLASRGARGVFVFEREEALGTGSTAKCAGGVRLQFSTEANVEMSRVSIAALKRFPDELGVPVDFKQNGYLFVLTSERQADTFRTNAEKQRKLGVPVEVLTPEEARRIVPELRTDDVVAATFCGEDGIANPHAIVQGYASGARRRGATFVPSSEVTSIEVVGTRAVALVARGERWETGTVVNAAGPWAKQVGKLAGLEIPVEPVRRQYFVTKPLEWARDTFPLLIDWGSGVYMHKESGGMLVGESDPSEPPGFNQHVDWDFLARVSEHAVHRVPRLEEAEISRGVAGLYEVSPDHNAVIGHAPGIENFVCANGFSGHGMQHAPAVGIAVAELVTEGLARSVDLSAYSLDRFGSRAVAEYNVI